VISRTTVEAVATITIDDPEHRNALNNDAIVALRDAVDAARTDADIRVIVLTGAGHKAFSAGGDLSGGFVDSPLPDHQVRGALVDLFRSMWANPKPIVGRVNGAALGGGLGIAAACDITIAADTATFGTPEINLGLWPMMISTVLAETTPNKKLLEMMMLGRVFGAHEAMDLGIVTRVVSADRLDEEVGLVVGELLSKSPAALALGKTTYYAMQNMDSDTALDYLHIGLTAVSFTEDAAEGVEAFTQKRKPVWKAR